VRKQRVSFSLSRYLPFTFTELALTYRQRFRQRRQPIPTPTANGSDWDSGEEDERFGLRFHRFRLRRRIRLRNQRSLSISFCSEFGVCVLSLNFVLLLVILCSFEIKRSFLGSGFCVVAILCSGFLFFLEYCCWISRFYVSAVEFIDSMLV
jgi:hypothetical protein